MRGAAQERFQQPKGEQPEGKESHVAVRALWDALPMVLLWGFCALWPRRPSANSGLKAPEVPGGEASAKITQEHDQMKAPAVAPGDVVVSDAWVLLGPVDSPCAQGRDDLNAQQGLPES